MSDIRSDDVDEGCTSTPDIRRELCEVDWVEATLRALAYSRHRLSRLNLESEPEDLIVRAVELILDEAFVPSEGVASIHFILAVIKTIIAAEPDERGLLYPPCTSLPSLALRYAVQTAA